MDKKYLSVFIPTEGNPLGLRELVVFSYLAYQDSFGTRPDNKRIAANTGMDVRTVAAAITELNRVGFLTLNSGAPLPMGSGYFKTCKAPAGKHWRFGLAGWRLLILRSGQNGLSFTSAAVYSLLVHRVKTAKNKRGIKYLDAYISNTLRITPKTADKALKELTAAGLIEYDKEADILGSVDVG